MTVPTSYNYQAVQASGTWAGMSNLAMTTTTATVDSGETVSSSGPDENSYRWAAVTQLSPLRIQLDGENVVLAITPESLVDSDILRVGTRCWVQMYGKRVVILGASGGGSDIAVPIGTITPYAGASAPNVNWLVANGAAVSRTTYAQLFAVCGTTFGSGDGSTTFNVPNLVNKMPVGSGGLYARGATGGEATHALTSAEVAAHTHSFSASLTGATAASSGAHTHSLGAGSTTADGAHSHTVGNQGARSDILAGGGTGVAASGSGSTSLSDYHSHQLQGSTDSGGAHTHTVSGGTVSGTTGSTGSGTAHENMPPYVAMNFIIRAL